MTQCSIIQFSSFIKPKPPAKDDYLEKRRAKNKAKLLELTTSPEALSGTCKNSRLRTSRRDAWWAANRLTRYWRARLDWHSDLSLAQQYDIAESRTYAKCEHQEHHALVDQWRAALVRQMLTPAPDTAAVAWKRATFRGGQHAYTTVKPKLIEQSIADDVKWLSDHPTRKGKPTSA